MMSGSAKIIFIGPYAFITEATETLTFLEWQTFNPFC